MKATKYPDGRVEFDGTPAEIAAVFGATATITTSGSTATPAGPTYPSGTARMPLRHDSRPLPRRVASHLQENAGKGFRARELADMFSVEPNAVAASLSRLVRDPKSGIRKMDRGEYGYMPNTP